MEKKEFIEFLEKEDFSVNTFNDEYEIESWTKSGVNMLIYVENPDQFIDYVNDFDIDEQIILHREAQDYRSRFTITESVKDFLKFHKRLKKTKKRLLKIL